jgi:hypothetical protein
MRMYLVQLVLLHRGQVLTEVTVNGRRYVATSGDVNVGRRDARQGRTSS